MRRLEYQAAPIALCTAATAPALPPGEWANVVSWNDPGIGCPGELDLAVWADLAVSVTNAVLYGARRHPHAFADITVSAVHANDFLALAGVTANIDTVVEAIGDDPVSIVIQGGAGAGAGTLVEAGSTATFTLKTTVTTVTQFEALLATSTLLRRRTAGTGAHVFVVGTDAVPSTLLAGGNAFAKATAHGLLTGDGPVMLTGADVPAGSDIVTTYWVIKTGANTWQIAASLSDALDGTAVELEDDGSGAIKLVDVEDATNLTQRLYWSTHDGLLGLDQDGAFDLDAGGPGYSKRIPHSPLVFAYALVATLNTGALSAVVHPIQDR